LQLEVKMISVSESIEILKLNIQTLGIEIRDLIDSIGCVLASDVLAKVNVPSFDNSAMDGYAICFENGNNEYQVAHQIQAGDTNSYHLKANEAARIYTGAPVPKNTNAVIQQEIVSVNGSNISFDPEKFKMGMNIRTIGSQCSRNQIIASQGVLVTPAILGLLASAGVFEVEVYKMPKVSVIITGNELQKPNHELEFGQIYNSNEFAIVGLLKSMGMIQIDTYQVIDELIEVEKTVQTALEQSDVLIVTGGVSVGDFDFVNQALENNQVKSLFYKVKQKPGKPLLVGKKQDQWVFALPGNPAAVITCFNQYVKPCLMAISGQKNTFEPTAILPLKNTFKKAAGLTFFVKGKFDYQGVEILQGQESFNLLSFNVANCIVKIEDNIESLEIGSLVEVYPLD
jgi:molybdopterin molybdotransferase